MAVMMEMKRERWTDERLDKAFDRVDADLRELRVEMRRGFDKIDERLDKMDERFDERFDKIDERFDKVDKRFETIDARFYSLQAEMNTRFEAVQRNMLFGLVGLFGSIAGTVIGAVLAAHSLG